MRQFGGRKRAFREMANFKFNALTARRVATVKDPGVYVDGLGLRLVVDDKLNRRWVLRVAVNGRIREMGLGSAREVSLAEARDRRDAIRRQLRDGIDPLATRREKAGKPDFETLARRVWEAKRPGFKNPKHAQQWIDTLKAYAFPKIGKVKVDEIDALMVREAVAPIWGTKRETAGRVLQRIKAVLDVSIAEGLRPGPNPALGAAAGLSAEPRQKTNFAALPWSDVPNFWNRLQAADMTPAARLAFGFLILTAARTSEVLGARWDEIDTASALWIVPGARMKMKREHRVPLAPAAVAILDEARRFSGSEGLIFPGAKAGRPLSNMVFLMALRRMGLEVTAHGFRSSFRDWAEECTDYSREVKEAALAHAVRDKVEAAYRRGDLLDARRGLMNEWADYVTGGA